LATTNSAIQLPASEVPRIAAFLQQNIEQSQRDLQKRVTQIEEGRKLYDHYQVRAKKPWPEASDVHIPMVTYTRNRLLAQRIMTLFGTHPIFSVNGQTIADDKYKDQVEQFLETLLTTVMPLERKIDAILQASLDDGVGIAYLDWWRDVRTVTRQQMGLTASGDYQWTTVPEERVLFDGPDVQYVPIENFGVCPTSEGDLQRADGVWMKTGWTGNKLLSLTEKGAIDQKAMEEVRKHTGTAESVNTADAKRRGVTVSDEPTASFLLRTYDIHVCYWKLPVDENAVADDWLIWYHLPTQTILRAVPNPNFDQRRPFVRFCPFPDRTGIFGDSLPDMIGVLQKTASSILEQMVDQATMDIHPPILMENGAMARPDSIERGDYKSGPGRIWKVNKISGVQHLRTDSTVTISLASINFLETVQEKMVSLDASQYGVNAGPAQTATATQSMNSNAAMLFALIVNRDRMSMVEIANQIQALCYEYVGNNAVVDLWQRLIGDGDNPYTIAVDALGGRYHFNSAGNTETSNKELKRAVVREVLNQLTTNPALQPLLASNPLHIYDVAYLYLKEMGIRSPEDWIGKREEVASAMAATGQAQQQLQQAEAAGLPVGDAGISPAQEQGGGMPSPSSTGMGDV
jgi:hypothetical protein